MGTGKICCSWEELLINKLNAKILLFGGPEENGTKEEVLTESDKFSNSINCRNR